jgi:hypothetical protein
MEIKCLELRDTNTFIPVICIRPVAENESQRYLLQRDGYRADHSEHCIIMIDAQCRGCSYDPYNWIGSRTKGQAHSYIEEHWHDLTDGDVIDVQFILGETKDKKRSEREGASVKMREIEFTQYLRPDGRRASVAIERPVAIVDLADAIIARGYRFECEHLTTGHASFTITNEEGDAAIEVVPNGPEVPIAIDRMIERFARSISNQGKIKI